MHQCEIKFNSLFLLWLSHSFNAAASKAMLFFYGGNRWKEAAVWPTITCEGVITVIFESKTTFPRVSNSRTIDKICCSKILQTNIFASFFFLLLLFFFSDFVISRFFSRRNLSYKVLIAHANFHFRRCRGHTHTHTQRSLIESIHLWSIRIGYSASV